MSSAPSLRDLQRWMKWVITDPRGVESALSDPRPNVAEHRDRYNSPTESQLRWINEIKVPSVERLNVYAEGYFFRMVECLEKDFPRVKLAVGGEAFSKLVSQYLKVHPSKFISIDEVGCRFADLIANRAEAPFAWLPDLALLEWSLIEAFYAPEIVIKANWSADIANKDAEELRFQIHPSVRLIRSDWSLPKIWRDLEGSSFSEPETNYHEPSFLLVYRRDDHHCWEPLEKPYFEVLEQLRSGLFIGDATSHLPEESAAGLSAVFSSWVQRGILSGILER